jgi:DNA-directed RNA polymerase subunit RPC12/RpoP
MRAAYIQIQAERARPPVEAPEPVPEARNEVLVQPSEESFGQVKVARGCDIIGGKFEYKVKVKNETGYVVTNVTVSIVAFPQDCMEMAGETVKSIPRIEVGGFRSPQFTLFPTKDCVQGKVVATVSYIDFRDQLHTTQVEPCIIRSVCDLLKPSEKTSKEFDLLLSNLTKTNQEQTMDWNARILFTKAEKLLPAKNFHIVDTDEKVVNGDFIGTIRGYAEGKYTGKKVAVVFLISGSETGRQAQVKVDALGEDVAMLPITIDELAESMDSWICLRCGAPFDAEQVQALEERKPVSCRYCSHTLTIGLYLQ